MFYRVEISNKFGKLEMGTNTPVQLTEILGIGLPSKSVTNVQFRGAPGVHQTSIRDNARVITIKGEFYGRREDVKRFFRVLYHECTIKFMFGDDRRQITGKCMNPDDFVNVGGGIKSFVIQFECDFPYFEDFFTTNIAILTRRNHFPNLYENGEWYIQLDAVATTRHSEADITNFGDVEIYPIIKISNAREISLFGNESIDIYNETTDVHIKLNYTIALDELITIDLPNREIISNINGDITNYISDDTELSAFKLALGTNHISVATGTDTTALTCAVEYKNNYVGTVF